MMSIDIFLAVSIVIFFSLLRSTWPIKRLSNSLLSCSLPFFPIVSIFTSLFWLESSAILDLANFTIEELNPPHRPLSAVATISRNFLQSLPSPKNLLSPAMFLTLDARLDTMSRIFSAYGLPLSADS